MSTSDDAIRARLRALASTAERNSFQRMSTLFPEIVAAIEAGVPQSAVVEALNAEGLAITPKTFSVYLHRLRARRRPASMAPLATSAPAPTNGALSPAPSSASASAPSPTPTPEGTTQ